MPSPNGRFRNDSDLLYYKIEDVCNHVLHEHLYVGTEACDRGEEMAKELDLAAGGVGKSKDLLKK